jgi:hypothetical protein
LQKVRAKTSEIKDSADRLRIIDKNMGHATRVADRSGANRGTLQPRVLIEIDALVAIYSAIGRLSAIGKARSRDAVTAKRAITVVLAPLHATAVPVRIRSASAARAFWMVDARCAVGAFADAVGRANRPIRYRAVGGVHALDARVPRRAMRQGRSAPGVIHTLYADAARHVAATDVTLLVEPTRVSDPSRNDRGTLQPRVLIEIDALVAIAFSAVG